MRLLIDDDAAAAWAVFFARLALGLIFFMAGVWKVFSLGPARHVRKFFLTFQNTFLPVWSLWLTGFTIPFVELIAGALLLLGFKTRPALVALGFVLVIITFGHLLENPLYAFHEHMIPRLALLLFVLMVPAQRDRYSIDSLLQRSSRA
ncbi:MAG: DoxX family membrane protein [Thermoanaerobaculia bacterium]